MKLFLASVLVLSSLMLGTVGCAEKSSTTEETKVATPAETTSVAVEKKVEKTGDNPPAEKP